jgi:hypothetical protein
VRNFSFRSLYATPGRLRLMMCIRSAAGPAGAHHETRRFRVGSSGSELTIVCDDTAAYFTAKAVPYTCC